MLCTSRLPIGGRPHGRWRAAHARPTEATSIITNRIGITYIIGGPITARSMSTSGHVYHLYFKENLDGSTLGEAAPGVAPTPRQRGSPPVTWVRERLPNIWAA